MIKLNKYINEAWSGMKQHSLKADIEAWCEEMGIKRCTINSKGEIDVDGGVDLRYKDFKELPYKFGIIKGSFALSANEKLKSLKNCPNEVRGYFGCSRCTQLNSLEGCPKEVEDNFLCTKCKRNFTEEEVTSLCKVKGYIYI